MSTDWQKVADSAAGKCTSEYYRKHAIQILGRVERLGPVNDPTEEFERVYSFLHYNEPSDVRRIVQELLERTSRKARGRLHIANNAWQYTVAAYDQWYGHARILYLAAGLIEGTLRSRLNERLTHVFGDSWSKSNAVPSAIREAPLLSKRAARMVKVENRLSNIDSESIDLETARKVLADIKKFAAISEEPEGDSAKQDVGQISNIAPEGDAVGEPSGAANLTTEPATQGGGAAFLADLALGQLLSFFTTKRLHGEPANLRTLLTDQKSGAPIPLSQIQSAFDQYRRARNNVAHYILGAELSFAQALFNAATIASWLGVDLQHFYSSVDVRQSTELSRALSARLPELLRACGNLASGCEDPHCRNEEPHDWMLIDRAPRDGGELTSGLSVRRACLVHRVTFRTKQHKHVGL